MNRLQSVNEFAAWQKGLAAGWDETRPCLKVCDGTGCRALGSQKVLVALREEIKRARLDTAGISPNGFSPAIEVVGTGCPGFCECGPLITIYPQRISYQKIKLEDVPSIVEQTLLKGQVIDRLLYTDPQTGEHIKLEPDLPFYQKQKRLVLDFNGRIDPTKIEDYLALGGYTSLAKALTIMQPAQIIAEVKSSGLRGRGGAGFPAGLKWELCRNNVEKVGTGYIICNADEGDPGAFMDRSVMEGNPHSVIEGMIIGAYTMGVHQGFVYIRAEYPLAVDNLRNAIRQADAAGLLGKDILGSGFDFTLGVRLGAGAFVCGEETALMASIEGRIGEPRPRPPYPAEQGLWGKPTNINNVETWANIPYIIAHGGAEYSKIGTEKSKGTKIFSVVGKINNTGLVEVPMGISLREVIYEVGGGIPKGKKLKAVNMGGPSGGCVPAEHLDVKIDYESLTSLGAIMGSGGMVVADEDTCMVDFARYFMNFTQQESCGKCVPCRLGTKAMLATLERICAGKGQPGDVEYLLELAEAVQNSSLCALGQTAPNPVLTTIRYFRDEYDAHIFDKHCSAGVCKPLVRARCTNACPAEVDIPSYVALIARGRYAEGLAIHRRQNPFALICGRVCPAFCEEHCRRADLDDPVAIRAVKRFMADHELERPWVPPLYGEKKNERVAVVGAGPAGLTAALRLAQMGYGVTIFEKLAVPGGMMAVGIPEFRLPHALLNQEIDNIRRAGVDIQCNRALGRDFTLDSLFKDGYSAVVLAIGAHKSQKIGVEHEDKPGVLSGVDFLREVALGIGLTLPDLRGKRVGVVGGGNVATDAARTAWRLGASEVHVIYRRRRQDMPAYQEEIEATEVEGAIFHFLTNPTRVLGDKAVTGVECLKQALSDFDRSGRRRPVPIPGSEFVIELDVLIAAIGQEPDQEWMSAEDGIQVQRGSTFTVNDALGTSRPGVFAAGDDVLGPASVVEAVAQGNNVARSVEHYLRTGKMEHVPPSFEYEEIEEFYNLDDYAEARRPEISLLSVENRRDNFAEVELVMDELAAQEECKRCLRCDLDWLQVTSPVHKAAKTADSRVR